MPAPARITLTRDALATLIREEVAAALAQASAPVAAPAKAQAKAPNQFVEDMRARAAAKVPCALHDAAICDRTFSPTSRGNNASVEGFTGHIARKD